jgi:mannitol/fructose-specific phosphotransferase system IIA component (Ntr-type)
MKALLNALHDGRLVELPDPDKTKSLEYLANLIEAVPDLPNAAQLFESVMARETSQSTALGMGVACPHVRAPGAGDLLCAVGWSPKGIEYAAPDGKPVHLVLMYYIPDSQMNVYLKELSGLAGAVRREGGIASIATASDIATVRERLLDWVGAAIDASIPEAKARMIRLEARQAAAEAVPAAGAVPGPIEMMRVSILQLADQRPIVLCQDADLVRVLEGDQRLGPYLQQRSQFEEGAWRLIFNSATAYGGTRTLFDYWALRPAPNA